MSGHESGLRRTLVLLRHGKSDWSGDHAEGSDRDRPLKERGRRQAEEAGRWLAAHGPPLELTVVSPARRAADTWTAAAGELREPAGGTRVDERAYTFDGDELLEVVRGLPSTVHTAAVVGHNPALEELLRALTGRDLAMPTSCLAVVTWAGDWRAAGRRDREPSTLTAHGRPPP